MFGLAVLQRNQFIPKNDEKEDNKSKTPRSLKQMRLMMLNMIIKTVMVKHNNTLTKKIFLKRLFLLFKDKLKSMPIIQVNTYPLENTKDKLQGD